MIAETTTQDIVYALAASPDFGRDGICFAARASGLYRSTDGGKSWQPAYASLKLEAELATPAVALSPAFAEDRRVFAGVAGGVLRSTDGGETWQISMLPSPPPVVSTLALSPDYGRDGIVFAGTLEDGVFYSKDRGQSWAAWNFGLLDLNVLALAVSPNFTRDETLFVGTDSGIYRSTNGGRAWREVEFAMEYAPVLSLALSPGYAVDGILFAGTEEHGLFKSDDRGQSWTRVAETTIARAVNAILLSPHFPQTADVLVMLGDALLISRDGGQRWASREARLTGGLASVVAPQGLAPDAPLLVGLTEGGVLRV